MGEKLSSYSVLASYYDSLMQIDYTEWVQYLQTLWNNAGINPKTILDVGCGTGNITYPLIKQGFNVYGVDISAEMIHVAKQKAETQKSTPQLFIQDICKLDIDKQFDVVIAACDALNYILDEENLLAAFERIAAHTVNNGLFLFDLNSEMKLREIYGEQSYAELYSDFAYFWDNNYCEKNEICEMELTFFIPAEKELYSKITEIHQQKLWRPNKVFELLHKAQWEIIGYYGFFTYEEPIDFNEKWQFVARKKI